MTTNAPATTARWIEWDMGTYGPFADDAEARAFQRANRMTGSSITDTEPVA